MQSVKVRRGGISAGHAADVIARELGGGYQVEADGDSTLRIRKGMARARVSLRAEPGGTVFEVSGEGASPFPLFALTAKAMNSRGIARRTVAVIGAAQAFRDDG